MSSARRRTGAVGSVLALAVVISPATAVADTTGTPTPEPEPSTEAGTLTLLNFNDFHGRLNDTGMAMAMNVERERAKNPNSLLLSAGDNVGGSLFVSSADHDEPTIDFLNTLGLHASAVGNHEFDQGQADLDDRIIPNSDYPNLGANVRTADGGEAYQPYELLETSSGHTVAVIGAVTPETTTLVSPAGVANLDFQDGVEWVNHYAQQLSDGDEANDEADIIVASYHEGVDAQDPANDPIVAETDAAVDAIITGHTHEEYILDGAVPGEDGETRPVMQTGEYAGKLGKIDLEIDENGEITDYTATNIESQTPESDQEAADFEAEIAANPMLTELRGIIDDAETYADEVGSVEMGTIQDYVTTGYREDAGFDQRDLESTMGHLVADAWLYAANETEAGAGNVDIGMVNPGGLRDEFPGGLRENQDLEVPSPLTVAQAVSVNPFANTLFLVDISGAQLRDVLEQQWQTEASGEVPSRPYLQLGLSENVRYTYTSEVRESGNDDAGHETRGENIDQIWVNNQPVLDDDQFTVALPSFLAAGGDNFRELANGHNHRDTGLIDTDAFQSFVENGLEGEVSPRDNKQAVQLTDLEDSYATDEDLSFELADLGLFSFGATQPEQLDVSIAAYPGDDARGELRDEDYQNLGSVDVVSNSPAAASTDVALAEAELSEGTHVVRLSDEATGTEVTRTVELTQGQGQGAGSGGSGGTESPTPTESGTGQERTETETETEPTPTDSDTSAAPAGNGGGHATDGDDAAGDKDAGTGQEVSKDRSGNLANTGAEIFGLVIGGVVILGIGAALLLRRRASHQ